MATRAPACPASAIAPSPPPAPGRVGIEIISPWTAHFDGHAIRSLYHHTARPGGSATTPHAQAPSHSVPRPRAARPKSHAVAPRHLPRLLATTSTPRMPPVVTTLSPAAEARCQLANVLDLKDGMLKYSTLGRVPMRSSCSAGAQGHELRSFCPWIFRGESFGLIHTKEAFGGTIHRKGRQQSTTKEAFGGTALLRGHRVGSNQAQKGAEMNFLCQSTEQGNGAFSFTILDHGKCLVIGETTSLNFLYWSRMVRSYCC
ncbi:hypothetical protein U9M48_023319 [Paspalum notatum var. saurae]|uniref:Uncharacterized protein n=1 Tax=Paspalum notatum var. saurae TaxID=547442 RepID=A0AAQ3TLC7_PASNO